MDAQAPLDPTTYASVIHFLAAHMRLLDEGKIEEWAAGFAPEGEFASEALPAPVVGRDRIRESGLQAATHFQQENLHRRHFIAMTGAERLPNGDVIAVSYALTLQTEPDASAAIRHFNICTDLLHPVDPDGWQLVSRSITRP